MINTDPEQLQKYSQEYAVLKQHFDLLNLSPEEKRWKTLIDNLLKIIDKYDEKKSK